MAQIDDPEVLAFIARTEAAYPPEANTASAADNRRTYDAMCAVFRQPRPDGVSVVDDTVATVGIRTYRPAGAAPAAAVLFAHGGGFVVGSLDSHDDVCAEIAQRCGLAVVAVDYRLAPEHRHPAQLDDLETVWRWLSPQVERVVLAGDSAGGCLSAGLALRLRRHGESMPAGLVLTYPGLGGDRSWPSYTDHAEAPMLRTSDLAAYETARFGVGGPQGPIEDAHPLAAADYAGLPPTFVVTADVDPLRDDGRVFVERLAGAGVAAVWRNEPQLVHGYLRARHSSRRAAASFAAVCEAVARFGRSDRLP